MPVSPVVDRDGVHTWLGALARWGWRAASALVPPRCVHCGDVAAGAWDPWLCPPCAAALRPGTSFALSLGPADDLPVRALWAYVGPARSLIHALKYRGAMGLARPTGRRLAGLLPGAAADLLVPVPLHWKRRWRRGFNQAELLARAVARARPGVRVAAVVRRHRATPAQARLRGAQRRGNVAGAFRCRAALPLVPGTRAVIVDDVVTTGATLVGVARSLQRAGLDVSALAAAVSVTTLRRAVGSPRRGRPRCR